MDIIEQIGAYAGLASVVGLAVLAALYFSQARDVKRLREWAGRAPERGAGVVRRPPVPTPGQQQRVVAQPIPSPAAAVARGAARPGAPPPRPGAPGQQAPTTPGQQAPAAPPRPPSPVGTPPQPPQPGAAPGAPAPARAAATGAAPPGASGPPTATPAAARVAETPAAEQGEGASQETMTHPRPEQDEELAAAELGADDTLDDDLDDEPQTGDHELDLEDVGEERFEDDDLEDDDLDEEDEELEPEAGVAAPPPRMPAGPTPAGPPPVARPASQPVRPTSPGPAPSPGAAGRPPIPARPLRPPAPRPGQPPILPPYAKSRPGGGPEPWYRRASASRGTVVAAGAVVFVLALGVFAMLQLGGDEAQQPAKQPAASGGGETQGGGEKPAKKAPAVDPAKVTVAVLNGTTVGGLAAKLGDKLEGEGFRLGNVTNSTDQQRAESVVLFAPGAEREAADVGRRLKIDQRESIDPESQTLAGDASVVVIAGADLTR